MALPVVRYASDCADFSKTVSPFISQLQHLPQLIFDSISSPAALNQIYLDTNPLISAFAFCLVISPVFLIVSEVNRNYSQVDRCWSILPTLYHVHYAIYAHLAGLSTGRLDVLVTISTLWTSRLTYNYWRKGGYTVGSEDYRWQIVREYVNAPLFFLFNVFFISLCQSVLLFLITTPAYILVVAAKLSQFDKDLPKWDYLDTLTVGAGIAFVLTAFIADQQQWNYHAAKQHYQKTAKAPPPFKQAELDRGFNTTGLWAYSRHPNFAAEQSFWVAIYQWSCFATGVLWNWTVVGAIAYLCLFQASTWLTELISAKKYPEYKLYQNVVAKFIPARGVRAVQWTTDQKGAESGAQDKEEAAKARQRYDLR